MSWTGEAPRVPQASASDSSGPGAPGISGAPWSSGDSGVLYRIADWGTPYFSIDARGHVTVIGNPGSAAPVSLPEVVREARRRRIGFPLMIRFPDILRAQVTRLHRAFHAALIGTGYGNSYRGLYPVKVNPLRHVVTEMLDAGRDYGMGLECGSRSELALALAHLREGADLLVCNGFKDESMLELAIDAQRLGMRVIPVLQSAGEFSLLRSAAANGGAVSALGVRIRLSGSISPGWDRKAAPDPKFGLSMAELTEALEQSPDVLRRLTLLHFHPGSQIADLARLDRAAREAAQVYATLAQRGAALQFLDVGGGLGVNYGDARDTAASAPHHSVRGRASVGARQCGHDATASVPNYSIRQYAETIVAAVHDVCRARRVPAPVLVSESGRAVTAQHAVLIVPVLSVRRRRGLATETALPPRSCDSTAMLTRWARRVQGPWDTNQAFAVLARIDDGYRDCGARFAEGRISMEEYAVAERAFVTASRRVFEALRRAEVRPPAEFGALANWLADRVVCDFSVFRSLPDHWAAGQAFPVMPIERLNERPSSRGILVDVTCDSDGRVDRYVSEDSDASVLPMHAPRPGAPADLGIFLAGAYEDVLGSAHNLLGRVSEIHVRLEDHAGARFRIDRVVPATSVAGMLSQMGYTDAELRATMGELVDARVAVGGMPPQSGRRMMHRYAACLRRSTYRGTDSGADPRQ